MSVLPPAPFQNALKPSSLRIFLKQSMTPLYVVWPARAATWSLVLMTSAGVTSDAAGTPCLSQKHIIKRFDYAQIVSCSDTLATASRRDWNGYTFTAQYIKSAYWRGNNRKLKRGRQSDTFRQKTQHPSFPGVCYLRSLRQWAAAEPPAFHRHLLTSAWCGHRRGSRWLRRGCHVESKLWLPNSQRKGKKNSFVIILGADEQAETEVDLVCLEGLEGWFVQPRGEF